MKNRTSPTPLRISLTVRRCASAGRPNRVRYEHGGRCLTPEAIVLRRWQARCKEPTARKSGTRFDGCRLPPGTWRVLHACFKAGLTARDASNPAFLAASVAAVKQAHRTWRAPHADKLAAMIRFLAGRQVLERVLSIERDEASPGIPDLFLYRVNDERGVHDGRFVEVKRYVRRSRYREPLSATQKRELEQLRGLGLRAGVVYLLE